MENIDNRTVMDEKKKRSDRQAIKSDLFYVFKTLYKRGLITMEELDKCNKRVFDGEF